MICCRPGQTSPTLDGAITERVFARDAMRIAIATERSGLEFYTRAAGMTTDPQGRAVFQRLAEEEKEHLGTLERRYAQLLTQDPELETRPTFLFFKGPANGLFAEGAAALRRGVNDQQALLIVSAASAARTSSSSDMASGPRTPRASRFSRIRR